MSNPPQEKKTKDKKKEGSSKPLLAQSSKGSKPTSGSSNVFSSIGASTNMFSQLSQMYQQQKEDPNDEGKEKVSLVNDPSAEFDKLLITKFEPDIQRILHSLSKKNEITKLRGLQELQELLATKEEYFFDMFLPSWAFLYKQFVTSEYDKKILEEVNKVLLIIVTKAKKKIAAQFKDLFIYWFLCMNDHNSEVASISNRAFESLFPPDKFSKALFVCIENIETNLKFFLKLDVKTILQENKTLNEGQAFEIYDRLTVASLNSVSKSIQIMKGAENEKPFFEMIAKLLELDALSNKKIHIIEILENKKRIRPRAASLDLINVILNFFPEDLMTNQRSNLIKFVLLIVDDKERMVQQILWKGTLLTALKKSDEEIWNEKMRTNFVAKFLECIKKCAFGISTTLYNNLVIVISNLSFASATFSKDEMKEEVIKNRIILFRDILDNMFIGIEDDEIKFFAEHLISSYFECLYFILFKRIAQFRKTSIVENSNSLQKFIKNVIRDLIKLPLYEYINKNVSFNIMSLQKNIPQNFSDLIENLSNIELPLCYYDEFFYELNNVHKTKCKNLQNFENYFTILKAMISKIGSQSIFFGSFGKLIILINDDLFILMIGDLLEIKAIDDFNMERQLGFLKIYQRFLQEISECAIAEYLKERIEETLEKFANLIIILFGCFKNLYKIAICEKYLWFLCSITRSWIALFAKFHDKIGDKEKINNSVNLIYSSLIQEISNIPPVIQITSFPYILIETAFFLDSAAPNSLFTDFFNLNSNYQQEEAYLNKILSLKNIKPHDDLLTFYQSNKSLQSLLILFTKVLLENKGNTISIVPVIYNSCKLLGNEETVQTMIENFYNFLKENKNNENKREKQVFFDKAEMIFLLASHWLTDKTLNKFDSAIQIFDLFFDITFQIYIHEFKGKLQFFFEIWAKAMKNESVENHLYDLLWSKLSSIIAENISKSCPQKFLNNSIEFVTDVLYFLKNEKKKNKILYFFSNVLFKPSNFINAFSSKNIWSLLVNAMENVNDVISIEEIIIFKRENFWLFCSLLSSGNSIGLLRELQIKKFLSNTNSNHLIDLLLKVLESNEESSQELFFDFLKYYISESIVSSLNHLSGLKNLMKHISLSCYDEMKINEVLKFIFSNLNKELSEKSIFKKNTDDSIKTAIVYKLIIMQFKEKLSIADPFKAETDCCVNLLWDILGKENEIKKNGLEFLISLDLLLLFSNFRKEMFSEEDYTNFTQILLKTECDILNVAPNYYYATVFEWLNLAIEEKTFVIFSDFVLDIEKIFHSCLDENLVVKKFYSKALINTMNFERKILSFVEAFSPQFQNFIINKDLDYIFRILKRLFEEVHDEKDEEIVINELNDMMIVDFAETIVRLSSIVTKEFNENTMYSLLNSPFPSIQKSVFLIMKNFYELCIPKTIDISSEVNSKEQDTTQEIYLKYISSNDFVPSALISNLCTSDINRFKNILHGAYQDSYIHSEEEEKRTMILNPQTFSYFLNWIGLFLKLNSKMTDVANEHLKAAIRYYLESNEKIYFEFLNNLFITIKTLNMRDYEEKESLKDYDLTKIELEWSDFLTHDSLFKLVLQAFYLFASNFPLFLRKWTENGDKKYTIMVNGYVKNYISNALFFYEIDLIEIRQTDWKTDEFNIFVAKNTREIIAVFSKEESELEISLKIPNDYPLKEIIIKCENEVKISKPKLKKGILRMKSLLKNQNSSIYSSLIIWKQNLEKEFEGLEECPICYYIIHSTTKELPKLTCKTCSHKFHSSCIHKWFNTSNKSECPLCKSQFV